MKIFKNIQSGRVTRFTDKVKNFIFTCRGNDALHNLAKANETNKTQHTSYTSMSTNSTSSINNNNRSKFTEQTQISAHNSTYTLLESPKQDEENDDFYKYVESIKNGYHLEYLNTSPNSQSHFKYANNITQHKEYGETPKDQPVIYGILYTIPDKYIKMNPQDYFDKTLNKLHTLSKLDSLKEPLGDQEGKNISYQPLI